MKMIVEFDIGSYGGPGDDPNYGWNQGDSLPYLTIDADKGGPMLNVDLRRKGKKGFKADADGAHMAGRELALNKFSRWMYSSSVDFPEDEGAPELDFRTLVENGWKEGIQEMGFTLDEEVEEIKRLSGIINEGRIIKVESEYVFDLMTLANSAKDECSRDPEHLQSMLSEIISKLNRILQGHGRR